MCALQPLSSREKEPKRSCESLHMMEAALNEMSVFFVWDLGEELRFG